MLVSQCGSWGDPGTGDAGWTIHLNDSSIKRLLETGEDIEATLGSVQLVGLKAGIVTLRHALPTHGLGPPHCCLPTYQQDAVKTSLGIMLQRESVVFNEGWAIHHAPIEERAERGNLTPLSVKLSTSLLGNW